MRNIMFRYYKWRKNRIPYSPDNEKRAKFALKAWENSSLAHRGFAGADLTGVENSDKVKKALTADAPLKNPDALFVREDKHKDVEPVVDFSTNPAVFRDDIK